LFTADAVAGSIFDPASLVETRALLA